MKIGTKKEVLECLDLMKKKDIILEINHSGIRKCNSCDANQNNKNLNVNERFRQSIRNGFINEDLMKDKKLQH